jgi:hypothetical protein
MVNDDIVPNPIGADLITTLAAANLILAVSISSLL